MVAGLVNPLNFPNYHHLGKFSSSASVRPPNAGCSKDRGQFFCSQALGPGHSHHQGQVYCLALGMFRAFPLCCRGHIRGYSQLSCSHSQSWLSFISNILVYCTDRVQDLSALLRAAAVEGLAVLSLSGPQGQLSHLPQAARVGARGHLFLTHATTWRLEGVSSAVLMPSGPAYLHPQQQGWL